VKINVNIIWINYVHVRSAWHTAHYDRNRMYAVELGEGGGRRKNFTVDTPNRKPHEIYQQNSTINNRSLKKKNLKEERSPFRLWPVYFLIYFKYHPEDDTYKVETCSWLTYYFYKVVFLTVDNLIYNLWNNCAKLSCYLVKIDSINFPPNRTRDTVKDRQSSP